MTPRARAIEYPAKKEFSFSYMSGYLERNLRSIGRDFARYFELDGICFFVEGFELGKRPLIQRNVQRVIQTVYILQHH